MRSHRPRRPAAIGGVVVLLVGVLAVVAVPATVRAGTGYATAGPTRSASDALTAGYFHTCVLIAGGSVSCWGDNASGQLGDGTTGYRNTPGLPINVPAGRTATAITSGSFHTCALLDNHQISCWGNNPYGQLGDGTTTNRNTPTTPINLPTGRTATAITAGALHTCALLDNHQITCWGNNPYGQLGDRTTTNRNTPTPPINLPTGRTATAITAGVHHTCALLDNHQITCWGNNVAGQLGDQTNINRKAPIPPINLPTGRTATAITAGALHTCALLDNHQITCWGNNPYGQLGDGTYTDRSAPPAPIAGLTVSIAPGPPGVPSVPQVTSVGVRQVGLRWSRVTDSNGATVTAYVVQSSLDDGASWVDVGGASVTSPIQASFSRTFSDLRAAPTLFKVAAVNAHGRGGWSAPTAPVTPTGDLPGAPGTPTAALAGAAPTVSWPAPGDDGGTPITKYLVETSADNGATWGPPRESTNAAERTLQMPTLPVGNYLFRVAAINAVGTGVWSAPSNQVTLALSSDAVTLSPVRLVETRTGPNNTTIDGLHQRTGPVPAGATREYKIAGRGGIPTGATAAIINIAAITPVAAGHITAHPCVPQPPKASTLNYATGQVIANGATIKLSATGTICITTHATTHLIIDVTGYLPATSSTKPLSPVRLVETRTGPNNTTIDGQHQHTGPIPAGTTREYKIAGRGGVPAPAAAAIVNIAAIAPTGPGHITAHPCVPQPPKASTLNYTTGQVIANGATIKLSATGTLCITTHATTHLIIDATGYLP